MNFPSTRDSRLGQHAWYPTLMLRAIPGLNHNMFPNLAHKYGMSCKREQGKRKSGDTNHAASGWHTELCVSAGLRGACVSASVRAGRPRGRTRLCSVAPPAPARVVCVCVCLRMQTQVACENCTHPPPLCKLCCINEI